MTSAGFPGPGHVPPPVDVGDGPGERALRARRVPVVPVLLVAWTALYLGMMAQGGWVWDRVGGLFGIGHPGYAVLSDFGAAVPWRLNAGQWPRALTSGWLMDGVVSLVLLGWWWAGSFARSRNWIGGGRTAALMVGGGITAALVHARVFPASAWPAPGPFAWVMALLGTQLALGLFGGRPDGRRLVLGVFGSLLMLALIMVVLTLLQGGRLEHLVTEDAQRAIGWQAIGGAFGAGFVGLLLFGPRRVSPQPSATNTLAGWLTAAALLVGIVGQVMATVEAKAGGPAITFLRELVATEAAAYRVFEDGLEATPAERGALAEDLARLGRDPFLDDLPGAEQLRAYLAAMQPIAAGDVPDPHGRKIRCRRAFQAWYTPHEEALRRSKSMRLRERTDRVWRADR